MASRVLRRRAVTAAALYGGTAAGILGTLIAVRVLGPDQFGVFTLALAAASFVQLLLDTTVEEAIVKYGFRYSATERLGPAAWPLPGRARRQVGRRRGRDGGRPRPRARSRTTSSASPTSRCRSSIAAFIPIAQAPEGIAGASMIVAGRYDLRAIFGGLARCFRLVGVAIGVQYGVTVGGRRDPVGQIAGSCASGYAGHRLFSAPPRPPGCRAPPRSRRARSVRAAVGHRHIARLDAEHARAARARHRRPDRPGRLLPRRAGADHRLRRALRARAPDPPDRADARRRGGPARRYLPLAAPLRAWARRWWRSSSPRSPGC